MSKIINKDEVKKVCFDVVEVFEKHNLGQGEVEYLLDFMLRAHRELQAIKMKDVTLKDIGVSRKLREMLKELKDMEKNLK